MNIAAAAAREYLKHAGRARVWPAHVARLVDANLSLMGQRIMARVRKIKRAGRTDEAESAFREAMREVGVAAAKEFLAEGNQARRVVVSFRQNLAATIARRDSL